MKSTIALVLIGALAAAPLNAGSLFTLDARLKRPSTKALNNYAEAVGHKISVPRSFFDREHLFYFAVTATSEASIDMGILSEVAHVKHVIQGTDVNFVRAIPTGSAEDDLVTSFKGKVDGDKVEIDVTTNMAIRLEGGVYKAEKPTRTQDVDLRADRLAYTQLFDMVCAKPAEGAPAKVTLGLRFFCLERTNPGFAARAYPASQRRELGFFSVGLFSGGNVPAERDYMLRRDVRKPIVFTLHPNVPAQFRERVTRGLLCWNKVFKATHGVEPIQVQQGTDQNMVPGDPDLNVIYWFTADVPKMYLGQAHPIADPRTGEIFCSYMLLAESEFRGGVAMTLLGNKIDTMPAKKTEMTAELMIGLGRGLKLVSRRCKKVLNETGILHSDEVTPEAVLNHIVDDTVPHEAGHSLGLRHNFKSSTDCKNHAEGQFTATVMEYMPEMQSPTEPQGYDFAAIAHGYEGKCPAEFARKYAYGTDEDSAADPDCNTFDLGEPLAYLTDHWKKIRKARPTLAEMANPMVFASLLTSAVSPLTKFMGTPSDSRFQKAIEFMSGILADQGAEAVQAGGTNGEPSTDLPKDFVYTKNLMERFAMMRGLGEMNEAVKVDAQAAQKMVDVLSATMVDEKKGDLFLARVLAAQALPAFGKAGLQAMVASANKIVAYAKANPQAATIKQEVALVQIVKKMLDQLQQAAGGGQPTNATGLVAPRL